LSQLEMPIHSAAVMAKVSGSLQQQIGKGT
jgi:hypothetical protein